jgi:hypothetical protein
MFSLKKRINNLLKNTENSDVKKILSESLDYYKNISANNLNNFEYTLSESLKNDLFAYTDKEIQKFLENEKRINTLNKGLGVNNLINSIYEDVTVLSNPSNRYKIGNLKNYERYPEWQVCEQVLEFAREFSFSPHVSNAIEVLENNIKENRIQIDLLQKANQFKGANSIIFNNISEALEDYIITLSKESKIKLLGLLEKYSFNFYAKDLYNYIKENSSKNTVEILYDDSSCKIYKNYSPVVYENGIEYFVVGGKGYTKRGDNIYEMTISEKKEFKQDFFKIAELLNSNICVVESDFIKFYVGDKIVKLYESGDIYVNDKIFKYSNLLRTYKSFGLFKPSQYAIVETILSTFKYQDFLCELDFVTTIKNQEYPNRRVDIFVTNEGYHVNYFDLGVIDKFVSNPTNIQIRSSILEHIGYDIGKSFAHLLEKDEYEIGLLKERINQTAKNIEYIQEKIDAIKENSNVENKIIKELLELLEGELNDQREKYFSLKVKLEDKTRILLSEGFAPNDIVSYNDDLYVVISYNGAEKSCLIQKIEDSSVVENVTCDRLTIHKSYFDSDILNKDNTSIKIANQNSQNSVSYKIF